MPYDFDGYIGPDGHVRGTVSETPDLSGVEWWMGPSAGPPARSSVAGAWLRFFVAAGVALVVNGGVLYLVLRWWVDAHDGSHQSVPPGWTLIVAVLVALLALLPITVPLSGVGSRAWRDRNGRR